MITIYFRQGIAEETARKFVTAFYSSLAQGAEASHESLECTYFVLHYFDTIHSSILSQLILSEILFVYPLLRFVLQICARKRPLQADLMSRFDFPAKREIYNHIFLDSHSNAIFSPGSSWRPPSTSNSTARLVLVSIETCSCYSVYLMFSNTIFVSISGLIFQSMESIHDRLTGKKTVSK